MNCPTKFHPPAQWRGSAKAPSLRVALRCAGPAHARVLSAPARGGPACAHVRRAGGAPACDGDAPCGRHGASGGGLLCRLFGHLLTKRERCGVEGN